MRTRFHQSAAPYQRRAFTLIEMITVVVILAVVMLIVLPSLGQRDDLSTAAAARLVVADLLWAQNHAIATGSPCYVSFATANSTSGGGFAIYNAKPFTSPVINPVTNKVFVDSFGAGSTYSTVQVSNINFDGPANTVIGFTALGQPTASMTSTAAGAEASLASTGTITLMAGSMTTVISIEPDTGHITLP